MHGHDAQVIILRIMCSMKQLRPLEIYDALILAFCVFISADFIKSPYCKPAPKWKQTPKLRYAKYYRRLQYQGET